MIHHASWLSLSDADPTLAYGRLDRSIRPHVVSETWALNVNLKKPLVGASIVIFCILEMTNTTRVWYPQAVKNPKSLSIQRRWFGEQVPRCPRRCLDR
jgi:hypothetical protein